MFMTSHYNDLSLLPKTLPLLPLHGAVLMPRAHLPVPIFEIDYLSLVADTLKASHIIGVVQPMLENIQEDFNMPLFKTGCAGRMIDINEIEDNHFIITLAGLCRFEILEEFPPSDNVRRAHVSYDKYVMDTVEESDFPLDRSRLLRALKDYFKVKDITPNWQEIGRTSNEKLITALTMVCPFEANEKQALLESQSLKEQSQMITTMLEIATLEDTHRYTTWH